MPTKYDGSAGTGWDGSKEASHHCKFMAGRELLLAIPVSPHSGQCMPCGGALNAYRLNCVKLRRSRKVTHQLCVQGECSLSERVRPSRWRGIVLNCVASILACELQPKR